MNFIALKTQVENITGTNTETGRFLNEGQLKLAEISKKRKRQNLSITTGFAIIPATCLIIQEVYWDNIRLEKYEEDILLTNGSGNPMWWTKNDESVYLVDGTGQIANVTGTAEIIFTARPATMALDTDAPELTDADTAMIYYCRWQNYVEGEDIQEAEYWENEWLKKREDWIYLNLKQNYKPRVVRQVI